MTTAHVFEVINAGTGNPVATFLNRPDAVAFITMMNAKFNAGAYRLNPIHIADRPFPATLFR